MWKTDRGIRRFIFSSQRSRNANLICNEVASGFIWLSTTFRGSSDTVKIRVVMVVFLVFGVFLGCCTSM